MVRKGSLKHSISRSPKENLLKSDPLGCLLTFDPYEAASFQALSDFTAYMVYIVSMHHKAESLFKMRSMITYR